MTFWQRSEIYSPCLVRMLARKSGGRGTGKRPMTWMEICDRSTLGPAQIEAVSQSTDWNQIELPLMQDFLIGCGVDFCDRSQMHRADEYLRSRPRFEHLHRSPEWKAYWLPLMIRWRKSHGDITKTSDVWPPLRDLLIRLNPLLKQ